MLKKEPWLCNENKVVNEETLDHIESGVAKKLDEIFKLMLIDVEKDHNMKDTSKRVAKMWVRETMAGRFTAAPPVTSFPNVKKYDQIYMVGPIPIRSLCAHHFQNIVGNAWIGVFPGNEVIGLSKFNRLVDWVATRPQIQEEMTEQIADVVEKYTKAKGVAVIIKAEHHCMLARGVRAHESDMTTSVMRGAFKKNATMRQEFLSLLQGMKGFRD